MCKKKPNVEYSRLYDPNLFLYPFTSPEMEALSNMTAAALQPSALSPADSFRPYAPVKTNMPSNTLQSGSRLLVYHNPKQMRVFLAKAEQMELPPVNEHLLYILCTNELYLASKYRSLVFYDDGLVLKTREPSNHLMKRLFIKIGVSYTFMCKIISELLNDRKKYTPFILGKYCYLPLQGSSRRNVSWISLSHIDYYHPLPKQRAILVHCGRCSHRIILPLHHSTFRQRLARAAKIYWLERNLAHYYQDFFPNFTSFTPHDKPPLLLSDDFRSRLNNGEMKTVMHRMIYLATLNLLQSPNLQTEPAIEETVEKLHALYLQKFPK